MKFIKLLIFILILFSLTNCLSHLKKLSSQLRNETSSDNNETKANNNETKTNDKENKAESSNESKNDNSTSSNSTIASFNISSGNTSQVFNGTEQTLSKLKLSDKDATIGLTIDPSNNTNTSIMLIKNAIRKREKFILDWRLFKCSQILFPDENNTKMNMIFRGHEDNFKNKTEFNISWFIPEDIKALNLSSNESLTMIKDMCTIRKSNVKLTLKTIEDDLKQYNAIDAVIKMKKLSKLGAADEIDKLSKANTLIDISNNDLEGQIKELERLSSINKVKILANSEFITAQTLKNKQLIATSTANLAKAESIKHASHKKLIVIAKQLLDSSLNKEIPLYSNVKKLSIWMKEKKKLFSRF